MSESCTLLNCLNHKVKKLEKKVTTISKMKCSKCDISSILSNETIETSMNDQEFISTDKIVTFLETSHVKYTLEDGVKDYVQEYLMKR